MLCQITFHFSQITLVGNFRIMGSLFHRMEINNKLPDCVFYFPVFFFLKYHSPSRKTRVCLPHPCPVTFPPNSVEYYKHIFFKLQFCFPPAETRVFRLFGKLLISCVHSHVMSTRYCALQIVNFLLTFNQPLQNQRIYIAFQQNSP